MAIKGKQRTVRFTHLRDKAIERFKAIEETTFAELVNRALDLYKPFQAVETEVKKENRKANSKQN